MATEKVTAQVTGEAAADGTGAGGWLIFGFLLPLIGVLVAYLRNPKVPAKVLAARPDDNASVARVFEVAYIERLKAKQVGNAWIGAAIGVSVVVLWQLGSVFLAEAGPVSVPQDSLLTIMMLVVGLLGPWVMILVGVGLAAASRRAG